MNEPILTSNRFDFINKFSAVLKDKGFTLGNHLCYRTEDVDPTKYSIIELSGKKSTVTKKFLGFTIQKTQVQTPKVLCSVETTYLLSTDSIESVVFSVFGTQNLDTVTDIAKIYRQLRGIITPDILIKVVSNVDRFESCEESCNDGL